MFQVEFRLKIFRMMFQDSQFKINFLQYLDKDFFEAEYEITLLNNLKKFGNKFLDYNTLLAKMSLTEKGKKDIELLQRYENILKLNEQVSDADAVYDTMSDFIIRSKLKDELADIYQGVENVQSLDMDGIPERLSKAINIIPTKDYKPYDYFQQADIRCANYLENENTYDILFPLYSGAEHLHCVQRNEFVVVGAAPTRGKSAVMLNFLQKAQTAGLKCVYITFEIRAEKIAERLDGIYSDVSITDFHTNARNVRRKVKLKGDNHGKNILIQEFASKDKTVSDIEHYLKYLRETKKFIPDIVFIDYIDLMKEDPQYSKLAVPQKLATIYASCVGLQQKLGITFITASQTNKTTTDKVVVSMEDLSDSPLQKMASVDKVFLFCQTHLMYEQKIFILHTDKDRNGPGRGTLFLYTHDWDKQIMNFNKQLSWSDVREMDKKEREYKKQLEKQSRKR